MAFLFIDITFDIAQVLVLILIFFCHLSGINSSNWVSFLTVFLVAFVFFEGLGLRLTCINKWKIVSRISFVSILILLIGFVLIFLSWYVAFWAFRVNFAYFWGWLEIYLYFYSISIVSLPLFLTNPSLVFDYLTGLKWMDVIFYKNIISRFSIWKL